MNQLIDFQFDQMARIGNDSTAFTQRNHMNTTHATYTTFNPFNNTCNGAVDFATNQPNVFFKSPSNLGPGGCNVDESSILNKSILTNPHIKISLHERPYKTVPYLGKGNVDVGVENKILWGDSLREKKSNIKLNDCSSLDDYPLMNAEDMIDPRKHIESMADRNWVRGGVPSREIYKNKEYNKISN